MFSVSLHTASQTHMFSQQPLSLCSKEPTEFSIMTFSSRDKGGMRVCNSARLFAGTPFLQDMYILTLDEAHRDKVNMLMFGKHSAQRHMAFCAKVY